MSISAVSSLNNQQSIQTPAAQNARALDGDYKTPGAGRSKVKDADGDYKAISHSPLTASSSAVLAAIANLKSGGQ